MSALPFRPTPFFQNKNRAFWTLQFTGWAGYFLLRTVTALANQQPWSFVVVLLIGAITGFSISLVLSVLYERLISQRPVVTWTITGVALIISVSIYAFVEAWTLGLYFPASDGPFLQRMLGFYFLQATLLGGWSALYYAINFFLQVEEQNDQLQRLEMQATSAQLAMLRYQLNPHFLFNTLNSISTLVLLKQTGPANAMLTRLSSFLRHTLVNEPGGKVTLAEEIETLKLYLDIERMRFEERLRTEFRIAPETADACLPSLLLQPLVENAIKYAVSPQEEGAQIILTAQLVGQRLRVTVSDTGPGLPTAGERPILPATMTGEGRMESTGVGLANIRDRLAQAYGEDHLFEIRTPPDGGFTVIIELPYETAKEDQPAALPPEASSAAITPANIFAQKQLAPSSVIEPGAGRPLRSET
ncbi:histidine kinase [Altererythrobacter sp. ZODW24]|uniref:sensor histidine kinase n=1 Tax=Altererythrobacter sp. ZODW24 TaxID=2185142 RepID=UPI000DF737F3|nr:histidine kinase [Altererythrobacter sp. ZODW24]